MHNTKTLIGSKFTRLTITAKDEARSTKNGNYYKCLCDCGKITSVIIAKLNNGTTKSCGCLRKERILGGLRTKHGMHRSKTYTVWTNMRDRCNNPNNKSFKDYGERGITYDPAWDNFEDFFNDMGACPDKLTLERVDVNSNYNKSNCIWDVRAVQNHNRRKLPCRNIDAYSSKIGVSLNLKSNRWGVKLCREGVVLFKGSFLDEESAALAYDNASELHYGDRPNGTIGEINNAV